MTEDTITTDVGTSAVPNAQYKPVAQGWECPRCGRINAPWKPSCCCPSGMPSRDWEYNPGPAGQQQVEVSFAKSFPNSMPPVYPEIR